MKKISIISKNQIFAEDLSQQIQISQPSLEVVLDDYTSCDVIFIDEDEKLLKEISIQNKTIPLIFFSSTYESSDYADIVIKKPFSLIKFLKKVEDNTLIPKIRHKECLKFKEYSLFPVKKEIVSSITGSCIKLTEKEVTILKYLYNNSPETIGKEELLENVWGYSAEMTTHTIETHIYRLRQKVEQEGGSQLIITENSGYKLNI